MDMSNPDYVPTPEADYDAAWQLTAEARALVAKLMAASSAALGDEYGTGRDWQRFCRCERTLNRAMTRLERREEDSSMKWL